MLIRSYPRLGGTLFFLAVFFGSLELHAQTWTSIATDIQDDGANSTLMDGKEFSFRYDAGSDSIWFKIDVYNMTMSQSAALGINIAYKLSNSSRTGIWWGTQNSTFTYNKLLTVWVTGTPPSTYTGTIGIANIDGVNGQNYANLKANNISIDVDRLSNSIILGMERDDFITDAELRGSTTITVDVNGAVGSNRFWNDDVYTGVAALTINTSPVEIEETSQKGNYFTVFPNPLKNNSSISFELERAMHLRFVIIDAQGKEVIELLASDFSSGKHQISLEKMTNFSKGVYFINTYSNKTLVNSIEILK